MYSDTYNIAMDGVQATEYTSRQMLLNDRKIAKAIVRCVVTFHASYEFLELPLARAIHAPFGNEPSCGVELLDAVVVCVCNVDTAVERAHGDTHRSLEIPIGDAILTPFGNEPSCGGELLDAVVSIVCNVDAAVGCHGDTSRVIELPPLKLS